MPGHASVGMGSSSANSAKMAAQGGTMKNRADTREASPCRIMVSSKVMATSELPTTRYASEASNGPVHSMCMGSSANASGAVTASPTAYCTRFDVTGCVAAP
ncbi:hypothetical protein D3C73_1534080 [compost metagenome]